MSASVASPCPTCGPSTSANVRNLAVFIDGTSNKPGDEVTVHPCPNDPELTSSDRKQMSRSYMTPYSTTNPLGSNSANFIWRALAQTMM